MSAECEARLQQRNQGELEALLAMVESRLGTPAERPTDLECAQTIAHRLANLLTLRWLDDELKRLT